MHAYKKFIGKKKSLYLYCNKTPRIEGLQVIFISEGKEETLHFQEGWTMARPNITEDLTKSKNRPSPKLIQWNQNEESKASYDNAYF